VPSIDLIDTPGLTMLPAEKSAAVEEILNTYVQETGNEGNHTLFLAVVPASGDARPATDLAMRFTIQKNLQSRTLGVFTKCDQSADVDAMCAVATGGVSADGDSAESLGGVDLEKGWVMTMLKPSPEPEFAVHNFERIFRQQNEDHAFFSSTAFDKIRDRKVSGIDALVERLEQWYSKYLNTTWKTNAMRKVLEKLHEKEFELKMLGVVPETTEKDSLARQEVERRMGLASPVKKMYHDFIAQKLYGRILGLVQRVAESVYEPLVWEGYDVNEKLEGVKNMIISGISEIAAEVQTFWVGRIREILTAECKVETDNDSQSVNVSLAFGGMTLNWFGSSQPKRAIQRAIRQQPFIQLSQYTEFTDAIISKCQAMYEEREEHLSKQGAQIAKQFVETGSPWLTFEADRTDGSNELKVKPIVKESAFGDALFCEFLRVIPSLKDLQSIHFGVTVGTETGAAIQRHEELREEIRKIISARDGIRRALSIDDAEFATLQASFDAE
jgi:hypothetical protein